jgi:hypothetical protein
MKKLMYLSISILCLSISALIGFHVGSQSVQAQAPELITGYGVIRHVGDNLVDHFVMLSNGDVWKQDSVDDDFGTPTRSPVYMGNFWGGTVPTGATSWGQIKGEYKGK